MMTKEHFLTIHWKNTLSIGLANIGFHCGADPAAVGGGLGIVDRNIERIRQRSEDAADEALFQHYTALLTSQREGS